jgi:hypothetical protein
VINLRARNPTRYGGTEAIEDIPRWAFCKVVLFRALNVALQSNYPILDFPITKSSAFPCLHGELGLQSASTRGK